jgi:hypothetical protein
LRFAPPVAAALLVLSLGAPACRRHRLVAVARPVAASIATSRSGAVIEVPRASVPPTIDGEINDPDWPGTAVRSGAFVDAKGAPAHPYSDARLLWHRGALDLLLYAADENVQSGSDAFTVTLIAGAKRATFRVGPKGVIADPSADSTSAALVAGAHFGVDVDATLDAPDDDDEEWVVESTIPLAALGLVGVAGDALEVAIERCDQPKSGPRICASFGTVVAPKRLRLR